MDAATPSKKSKTSAAAATPQKLRKSAALADQILTPEKPTRQVLAAASASEQIWTPEKSEQQPRARSRSVAFSVKEVRRAALGLRRPEKVSAAPAEEEDELVSVARELGVGTGAGRSPVKRKAEVKLPESYEMLCEFFNCLESSTRLLRMKGSKATFPNICASIQHLSERRFTYSHLAQLKYIMPEAIVINKILLRDDTTCCMKPDLQVNLLVGAIENVGKQKGETVHSALRRIFRQRLVDFFREHPEENDIPEHELPLQFNRTRTSEPQAAKRTVPERTAPMELPDLNGQKHAVMSHMSQSFKRRFSLRSPISSAAANTSPLAKVECTVPSPWSRNSLFSSDDKSSAKEAQVPEEDDKDAVSKIGISESTPVKFALTPMRLMASTPDLETPKRPISAAGYDTPPLKMVKRSARAKLFTTPIKGASSMDGENQSASMSAIDGDDELLNFLPQSLLHSVKEKEQRALEEKETGFADQVKRQKLIASLPSTFDVIFLIYQSRHRSVMTKQELIHKIIASSPKIVDRSEVEEQLSLLEELVPDWISEKTARSGDVLCCVDVTLSQTDIRQRLYAAE
ncbi:CDT1-like protein a, chloroplastic [Phragmites australis]|uniref:CDT1-like protein a, chloroplastic n=1 Tax=Phragmites australis TaxID=29695 RepID=UPI002D783F8B|nr:CDT1-like protein a, chloroplastic [Phragmites australis]